MTFAFPSPFVILLVEDDEGHAALIREALEDAGYRDPLRHFRDGQEVLNFLMSPEGTAGIEPGTAYLLLLDIGLPRVDGLEVLRRIKECPKLHHIPVIMLTGDEDPVTVSLCYRLGCNGYVPKTSGMVSFEEVLRRLGLFLLIIEVTPST